MASRISSDNDSEQKFLSVSVASAYFLLHAQKKDFHSVGSARLERFRAHAMFVAWFLFLSWICHRSSKAAMRARPYVKAPCWLSIAKDWATNATGWPSITTCPGLPVLPQLLPSAMSQATPTPFVSAPGAS